MKRYRVVKIIDLFGEEVNLEHIEFSFVGKDRAMGRYKGYGFLCGWAPCDGYTVVTEEYED